MKILLTIILFICVNSYSQTITINPADTNQSVVFGGDNKLTIKAWAEGNTNNVSRKLFQDMNLQILRVPIFALQDITDPIYDNVITVINSVKSYNPDVKIFASIANGDGYGVNHHGAAKFPSGWTGCCSYNVYSLNLTTYAKYLDKFMQRMIDAGITVDYLGIYNEDPGDDSDYLKVINQMTKLGTTEMVGLERWALESSVANVDDIEDRVSIVGSHFYDDATIDESNWDSTWASLVTKSEDPVWYTESTRYSTGDNVELLIAGLDNIFAPIRGGVEAVIFYQVCKRFVYANGSILPTKYSGFKNIVNNSDGKVVTSHSNDSSIKIVAFGHETNLDIHILNNNSTNNTVALQLLSNYLGNGAVTRKVWTSTDTGTESTYYITNKPSWNISVPANSYSHLKLTLNKSVLATSEQAFNNSFFKIFPNPSKNGKITINIPQLKNSEKINIQLFNSNGQKVFSETMEYSGPVFLDTKLPKGIYFIKVKSEKFTFNNKLMLSN